jgi:hypothetical protein
VGLNDPQAPALPHVTVQSTPAGNNSPVTIAATALAVPTCIAIGGGSLKETEISLILIPAEADFDLSAVDVATTITVLPVGTAAGAV